MQLAPRKPQIVRRSIPQTGNLVLDLGDTRTARSTIPIAASSGNGRWPASVLASRSVVGWGFHPLVGSAMR
jgi:hypothetical protein